MAEDFQPASIALLQDYGRFPGPRVAVTGYVTYHQAEPDGDYHIRLTSVDLGTLAADATIEDFVVCEIIPELPMTAPPIHAQVTVRGIARWDIEHGWPEIHPVLSWTDQAGNTTPAGAAT